ncbi:hypothetical protein SERLA73DRAFT_77056 [Serpula lacrymans var. lacrymans S7.3]|uniref:Uncharacterized protein n=1 Tax=Serpula lacrymans var. lacrymans (strain S7.3) TaxID=936435 RepID=F8Q8Y8_SERL3|nr:hypothetical protein SERLA73DRAFT_77056 [Serpula lacrymans var. lacrymans S7.3]
MRKVAAEFDWKIAEKKAEIKEIVKKRGKIQRGGGVGPLITAQSELTMLEKEQLHAKERLQAAKRDDKNQQRNTRSIEGEHDEGNKTNKECEAQEDTAGGAGESVAKCEAAEGEVAVCEVTEQEQGELEAQQKEGGEEHEVPAEGQDGLAEEEGSGGQADLAAKLAKVEAELKQMKKESGKKRGRNEDLIDGGDDEDIDKGPKKKRKARQKEGSHPPQKDETSEEKERRGQLEIKKFLQNPNGLTIDPVIRAHIRASADHFPEAARTSRQLALHCLTTNRENIICLFHQDNDKTDSIASEMRLKYVISGTPHVQQVNRLKVNQVERVANYLHCGCPEDTALFDFYLWKCLRATDAEGNNKESLKDQVIPPRLRYFLYEAMQDFRINIDMLYSYKSKNTEAQKTLLRQFIGCAVDKLHTLTEKDGEDKEVFGLESGTSASFATHYSRHNPISYSSPRGATPSESSESD